MRVQRYNYFFNSLIIFVTLRPDSDYVLRRQPFFMNIMAQQKKILISQKAALANSPYTPLMEKTGAAIDFIPFFRNEALSSREFRAQRINLAEYTAIVFSSRTVIDAFFKMAEELRVKIPETMKYFCSTENVALYLQKHIVYRKRKIFFGNGTPDSIIASIGPRHTGEKFLIATSGSLSTDITRAFEKTSMNVTAAMFVKPVSEDISKVDLHAYDAIVLYASADVHSLYENFPDFQQGDIQFITCGKSVVKALEEKGLSIALSAPTPQIPSIVKAIEIFLNR